MAEVKLGLRNWVSNPFETLTTGVTLKLWYWHYEDCPTAIAKVLVSGLLDYVDQGDMVYYRPTPGPSQYRGIEASTGVPTFPTFPSGARARRLQMPTHELKQKVMWCELVLIGLTQCDRYISFWVVEDQRETRLGGGMKRRWHKQVLPRMNRYLRCIHPRYVIVIRAWSRDFISKRARTWVRTLMKQSYV